MKKRGMYLVIALFLIASAVAQVCDFENTPKIKSLPLFEINEGQEFNYDINYTLEDEDATLTWIPLNISLTSFSLDKSGLIKIKPEKQDQGIHTILVVATTPSGCYDMKKIIFKVINKPVINFYEPEKNSIIISEAENILFKINASDTNGRLYYRWYLDDELLEKNTDSYLFRTNYSSEGSYEMVVYAVSESGLNASHKWNIKVNNNNRAPYLKYNLPDFVVKKDTQGGIVDLDNYILDADEDTLTFTPYFVDSSGEFVNTSKIFDSKVNKAGILEIYPKAVISLKQYIKINASDGDKSILTEKFSVRIAAKGEEAEFYLRNISFEECEPRLECGDWQECLPSNISVRECYDANKCNEKNETILEYQDCEYGATCSDNIKNQDEEGVDCGGPCEACPSCDDLIQNQGEEGIDCGGPCEACPSCDDYMLNQDETDIDCGGVCEGCDVGLTCDIHIDCKELVCINNICAQPTCNDNRKNQGEVRIDCGGPCEACPTCTDNILNQGEEEIDCGGPCKPCTSCNDGIKNQGEIFKDCGGPCECGWLDLLIKYRFIIGTIIILLVLFAIINSYIENHKKTYLISMSKLFRFLPSDFEDIGKNSIEAVNNLRKLQYRITTEQASSINSEYKEINNSFLMKSLEMDSISLGLLKKQLKRKVKNPFIRDLIVDFYLYISREINSSSLYKIEMNQKINSTIARINKLRSLIQNV